MPKSYSSDLRERVIEAEAAERFEICEFGDQMGAALVREPQRGTEATRGKHFSVGQVRGAIIGPDCRTPGSDFDGDNCGAGQAADSN